MNINNLSPKIITKFNNTELKELAKSIRTKIIASGSHKQLHYASNLGNIEIMMGLIKNLSLPTDKILIEGGYPCYAFKILTGRGDKFDSIREEGGLEGYPNQNESIYDSFCSGHIGDAIGFASGLSNNDHYTACVIGDGSLSNGETLEALNFIASLPYKKLLIVLNDNNMFISPPVGGVSHILKSEKSSRNFFESLGFTYEGIFDGNDIKVVNEKIKSSLKKTKTNKVLLHFKTKKGLGDKTAQNDTIGVTHMTPDNIKYSSFSKIICDCLINKTKIDNKLHVVNAAMAVGLNLLEYEKNFPNNYTDVGISEQLGVSMTGGLSQRGMKPVLVYYSTFIQRGYDQLLQNISRNNYPLLLFSCRADLAPGDGDTHHGIFDFSMFKSIPKTIITNPRNKQQIEQLINTGLLYHGIFVIRTPRYPFTDHSSFVDSLEFGSWEKMKTTSSKTCILSYGPVCDVIIKEIGRFDVDLINAVYTSNYKMSNLKELFFKYNKIIVYERVFGSPLADDLRKYVLQHGIKNINIVSISYNGFVGFGTLQTIDKSCGMDMETLINNLK